MPGIGCNEVDGWSKIVSGTWEVEAGILNIRGVLSGLSMDNDLNEDEDVQENRFGSTT